MPFLTSIRKRFVTSAARLALPCVGLLLTFPGSAPARSIWVQLDTGEIMEVPLAGHAPGSLQASAERSSLGTRSWQASASPSLAVCTATNQQTFAAAAPDGAGGMIVAWQDTRNNATTGADIYAQHVLACGDVDPAWPVNGVAIAQVAGTQGSCRITSDGAGGAYIGWNDSRNAATSGSDIYAQHVLGNGSLAAGWPANGLAVCTATGNQAQPRLTSDGTGGSYIVWQDAAGGRAIFAHHLTASGLDPNPAWTTNGVRATDPSFLGQRFAETCSDGAGGVIIVFCDPRNAGMDLDLFAQRISPTAARLWGTGGLQVCSAPGFQIALGLTLSGNANPFIFASTFSSEGTNPIVADGSGGCFVTWYDRRDSAVTGGDVYAQHILASGAFSPGWATNGVAVSTAPGEQYAPVLVADGAGGAIVTWSDQRPNTVLAQHVTSAGVVNGPSGGLALTGAAYTYDLSYLPPAGVMDDSGGAILAWNDSHRDTLLGAEDIYLQHVVTSPSFALDPTWPPNGLRLADVPSGDQRSYGAALPDGVGGILLPWEDDRNQAGADIFAQRVLQSGSFPTSDCSSQTYTVSGFVRADCPAPNAGIDGVAVSLRQPGGGVVVASTVTATGGGFSFASVTAGTYDIVIVTPAGYSAASTTTSITVGTGGSASADFALTCQPGTVSGYVRADCPTPNTGIAGVAVSLRQPAGGAVVASGVTGAGGGYNFASVASGAYDVEIVAPAGYSAASTTASVTVAPGSAASADFALTCQPGTVTGFVRADCPAPNTGIAGVAVSLRQPAGGTVVASGVTVAGGGYSFASVATGAYDVEIVAPAGYSAASTTASVTVAPGSVASADFALTCQPGTVAGFVRADCPAPNTGIAGVAVSLRQPAGGTVVASGVTVAGGGYSFASVASGAYDVVIVAPAGYSAAATTASVTVAPGGAAAADFALICQPGTLVGVVLADCPSSGSPVASVAIDIYPLAGANPIASGVTNEAGAYSISLSIPGTYEARLLTPPGYTTTTSTIQFTVDAGSTSVANFSLDCIPTGPGNITGFVVADCPTSGSGLFGVTVDAFEFGTGVLAATSTTNGNGSFTLVGLDPGLYTVAVLRPLGYVAAADEFQVTVSSGQTVAVNFSLSCISVTSNPQNIAFWKHQLAVAINGRGHSQIPGSTLCSYLDLIEAHFNSNDINPVVVYESPVSGLCADKLIEAREILNLRGSTAMFARAKKQLLGMLLNVAGGYLSQRAIVSEDGATLSQAITYCDQVIDNPTGNYTRARNLALKINNGELVPAGWIPLGTQNIAYNANAEVGSGLSFRVYGSGGASARFAFDMPASGEVAIQIFGLDGRKIADLAGGSYGTGTHVVEWEGRDSGGAPLANGLYFARLTTARDSRTLKVILMKR